MPASITNNPLASAIPLPSAVKAFFKHFPLYTYPALSRPASPVSSTPATLCIAPPTPDIVVPSTNLLSADVECLKWQAYIALRDVKTKLAVRWDIDPEGAVDGRLPALYIAPLGQVLGPRMIPGWVDDVLGKDEQDPLEGYRDEGARDESRAWVALLEGTVHVALVSFSHHSPYGTVLITLLQTLATPKPLSLTSLLLHFPAQSKSHSLPNTVSVASHLSPPPAPLSGFASLFPPYGERVSSTNVQTQYHDAIVALSDRLGSDQWFLASPYVLTFLTRFMSLTQHSAPTALDALLFAYLHCLLTGPDQVRLDVVRRANLVSWERRVRVIVQSAFVHL